MTPLQRWRASQALYIILKQNKTKKAVTVLLSAMQQLSVIYSFGARFSNTNPQFLTVKTFRSVFSIFFYVYT
jgi:hypothetical protein